MTVPGALEVVAELARQHPQVIVGAGTVLDLETARRCLDAGARFLTSPGLDLSVVEFSRAEKVAVWPGVLTPSEVMAARKAGCEMVKVFPVRAGRWAKVYPRPGAAVSGHRVHRLRRRQADHRARIHPFGRGGAGHWQRTDPAGVHRASPSGPHPRAGAPLSWAWCAPRASNWRKPEE
jgi:hypothetical protein